MPQFETHNGKHHLSNESKKLTSSQVSEEIKNKNTISKSRLEKIKNAKQGQPRYDLVSEFKNQPDKFKTQKTIAEKYAHDGRKELVPVANLRYYDSLFTPDKFSGFGGHQYTNFKDNFNQQLSHHDLRNLHHQHDYYLESKKKHLSNKKFYGDPDYKWETQNVSFEILDPIKGSHHKGQAVLHGVSDRDVFRILEQRYGKNIVRFYGGAKSQQKAGNKNLNDNLTMNGGIKTSESMPIGRFTI